MIFFARVDNDGIPDTQSFYDVGDTSRFSSYEQAVDFLCKSYTCGVENAELDIWVRENVKETSPGVWGLPTEPGVLFGYAIGTLSWAVGIGVYMKKDKYLQIFEGIPVNDYNPIRKASPWDGEQFIPVKLLNSWRIPIRDIENTLFFNRLERWGNRYDFSSPPWESE